MDRMDAINILKAITITVTTRAIGFGVTNIFLTLSSLNNVPIRGNIYQVYRESLAVFEGKLQMIKRSPSLPIRESEDYVETRPNAELETTIRQVSCLPDQISSVVNALGIVKVYDHMYVKKIASVSTVHNQPVPQSENVTFTNLRQVVLALSNQATPAEHRRRFRRNCPIPGTVWNDDDILVNPDDIMPDDYGIDELNNDIIDVTQKMSFMNRKLAKYFTSPISYETTGSKALLVCNEQNGMHVKERADGENLNDY